MNSTKKCPMCAEEIPADAVLCPYCGTPLGEEIHAIPPPTAPIIAPLPSQAAPPARETSNSRWITGAIVVVVSLGVIGTLLWINRANVPVLSGLVATSTPTATPTLPPTRVPANTDVPTVTNVPTIAVSNTLRPTATASPPPAWVTGFSQPILEAIARRAPDFQDDFEDKSGGWRQPEYNPCSQRVEIRAGELVLTDCRARATNSNFTDFVVEFDGRFMEDSNNKIRSSWMISFRNVSGGPNYEFGVLLNGTAYLNNVIEIGQSMEFQDAANPGFETNHFLMIGKGSKFAFYVNNKPLYYLENPSIWQGQGDIVLANQDGSGSNDLDHPAITAFDNFKIWNIADLP